VRRVTVTAAAGRKDAVDIRLAIANTRADPMELFLPLLDLVIDDHGIQIVESASAVGVGGDVAAHATREVVVRAVIPRGARARVLVYNDDDFPALFALPKAIRLHAKSKLPPRR
jgi:hypothetical protein